MAEILDPTATPPEKPIFKVIRSFRAKFVLGDPWPSALKLKEFIIEGGLDPLCVFLSVHLNAASEDICEAGQCFWWIQATQCRICQSSQCVAVMKLWSDKIDQGLLRSRL